MKIYYDKEADAAYIELIADKPQGVVEVSEGINVDMTADDKIIGIEVLDASKRMSLKSLFTFELDQNLVDIRQAS